MGQKLGIVALLLLAGCGPPGVALDSGLDAGVPDGASDAGLDAGLDAGGDAGLDGGRPDGGNLDGGSDGGPGNDAGFALFGGAGWDEVFDLVAWPDGAWTATGSFEGDAGFGPGCCSSKGSADVFVVTGLPDGTVAWARAFGGPGADQPTGIARDFRGNLVVAGFFGSSIDFGTQQLTGAGSWDSFVASLGPDGGFRWARAFGSPGDDRAQAIAVDPSGTVFLTGQVRGVVDFGGGVVDAGSLGTLFLASYAEDGGFRWARTFGGTGSASSGGRGLAVDPLGNLVVAGMISGPVDLGGGTTQGSTGAPFVASYSPSGSYRWSYACTSDLFGAGESLAIDSSGNAFVSGIFQTSLSCGGERLTTGTDGGLDFFTQSFLLSVDGAGQMRLVKKLNRSRPAAPEPEVRAHDLAVDGAGRVVVVGQASGQADFGDGWLYSNGTFAAAWDADGGAPWARQALPCAGSANAVASLPDGGLLVAGRAGCGSNGFEAIVTPL